MRSSSHDGHDQDPLPPLPEHLRLVSQLMRLAGDRKFMEEIADAMSRRLQELDDERRQSQAGIGALGRAERRPDHVPASRPD